MCRFFFVGSVEGRDQLPDSTSLSFHHTPPSPLTLYTHTLLPLLPQVYCRVRPLRNDEQESCAEVISDTVLQILPPECSLAFKSGHRNAVSKCQLNLTNQIAALKLRY